MRPWRPRSPPRSPASRRSWMSCGRGGKEVKSAPRVCLLRFSSYMLFWRSALVVMAMPSPLNKCERRLSAIVLFSASLPPARFGFGKLK